MANANDDFNVVKQIRARIVPEILSLRSRFAQFRGMSQAQPEAEAEAEPELASNAQPKRRRLIRDTALMAAKSLRAPIVDFP